MQLVLSNNRVIAHGENFLAMGGTVINTVTGAKYENATVAECDNCPSDINEVGYEYHAGVFKPCAPFGKGNNNGYFMEVCETCATPRSSGIPIKKGIKLENLNEEVTAEALGAFDSTLLWENADVTAEFATQVISLDLSKYQRLKIIFKGCIRSDESYYATSELTQKSTLHGFLFIPIPNYSSANIYVRRCMFNNTSVSFEDAKRIGTSPSTSNDYCIPVKIIGYEHL